LNPGKISLLVTIIALGLYLSGGGIYYEATTDSFAQAFMYGSFSGGENALPYTFGCYILLSSLINFLHNHIPAVNWYDSLHALVLFTCLASSVRLLWGMNRGKPFIFHALTLLILCTSMGIFFKPAEFTKTGMLAASVGLAGMFFYKPLNKRYYWFHVLLFLTGLLFRIEAGVLSFFICVMLILGQTPSSLTQCFSLFNRLLVPFLLILLVSFIVNYPFTPEDSYYLKIRPYEFAVTDFDRDAETVSLTSKTDSVIYQAGVNFFFADSANSNPTFFKRVGVIPFDKTPSTLLKRLFLNSFSIAKINSLFNVYVKQKWFLLLIALLCLITWEAGFFSIVISLSSVFLLITFVSLWLKPEEHVIGPTLSITVLFTLMWLANHSYLAAKSRYKNAMYASLTFVFCAGSLTRQQENVQAEKLRHTYYSNIADYVAKDPAKVKILNISTWDKANRKMFEENAFLHDSSVLVLDGGILYFNSGYQKKIREITGSKSFIGQWDFFLRDSCTVFVSSNERMATILNYINSVYNKGYKYNRQKSFANPPDNCPPIQFYKIVDTALHE
jgi:hypothetical protein